MVVPLPLHTKETLYHISFIAMAYILCQLETANSEPLQDRLYLTFIDVRI